MPDTTVVAFPAGGPEHQRGEESLARAGVRLPVVHRAQGRPGGSSRDLWCEVRNRDGALTAGVVVKVEPSRKVPWLHLGRIRHAGQWLDALHADRSIETLVTLRRALRHKNPRLARLSVHAYRLGESALEQLEGELRARGWQQEARERDYQRTSLVSLAGDTDALSARLAYSARRGIRGVEKGGWRVRRIEDAAMAPRLQFLHEQAHERTGGHASRVDLAAAVAASLADPTGSVVFGVYHPERTGPEALVGFVHGVLAEDAVVYSTAGTERAPDIGAAPLGYGMIWAVMCWAQALGVPWFDFGGITPEDQPDHPLARISEFKRKFRGDELRNASDWFADLSRLDATVLRLAGRLAALRR